MQGSQLFQDYGLSIDLSQMRTGQRGAIDAIINNVRHEKTHTAIVLPPRYGKSDVIRGAGVILMLQKQVSRCLILEPAEVLRHQIIDRPKMQEAADRYKLPPVLGGGIRTYEAVSAPGVPFPPSRHADAAFVSMTIQMANASRTRLVQWVMHERREKGCPPIVFVDEAHTGSNQNEWGTTTRMLAEAGAYIVLLTGTPYRSDGKRIYGFDFQVEQTKPVTLFKTREGADHNRVVDIYEGEKSILRIVPDWETTLREAWDVENPPSLCKMTRLAYDIDLTSFDMITGEQTGTETLSTLPPSRLSGQLMRLLREDSVIEAFCEILANQLHHRREDAAEAAAIVYVGNDQEGDDRDNDHAWRVVEALARIEPSFRCLVATSTTDNNAARTLRRFQDGEGDVLVVKQMGGTGLDVPRMKVCLDLSVVRTAQQYVQRVARIATIHRRSDDPNDVQMTAVYITPNDILGAALWESFVASQGGETFLTNLEYVRTIEAGDGKVPPTPEYFRPEGLADLDYYSDTNMQVSPGETLSTVEKVIEALPVLQRLMTLPDVEKALTPLKRALGMAGGDDVSDASATRTATILDSNEERKSTQRELNDLVKRVAERRLGRRYQRGDAEYGPTVKEVHWQHKSICGIARKKPDDYTPEDIAALKESLLRELQDDD